MKSLPSLGSKISLNRVFLALLCFSVLCLGFSFFMQATTEMRPCLLCLLQQMVYGLVVGLTIMGIASTSSKMAVGFLVIVLLLGCTVAAYHILVDYQVIGSKCHLPLDSIYFSLGEGNSTPLPCSSTVTKWRILNVPIEFLNLGIYLGMLFLLIKAKSHVRSL